MTGTGPVFNLYTPRVGRCLQDVRTRAALELLDHLEAAQRGAEPADISERPAPTGKSLSGSKARLKAAEQAMLGCSPLVVRPTWTVPRSPDSPLRTPCRQRRNVAQFTSELP